MKDTFLKVSISNGEVCSFLFSPFKLPFILTHYQILPSLTLPFRDAELYGLKYATQNVVSFLMLVSLSPAFIVLFTC